MAYLMNHYINLPSLLFVALDIALRLEKNI